MKNTFEIGEEVETSVVQISGDTVFIDLGLKSEGFVDAAEFRNDEGELTVHEGDKIKVFFVSDNRGELHFTTRLSGESAGNERHTRPGSPWKVLLKRKLRADLK